MLGPYEIMDALGAGGMGEVYRARDTKLNRDVAIKVLPEIFALDPDRLTRFTREAQTLAALNHPNIAAIYGIVDLPAEAGSYTLGRALGRWSWSRARTSRRSSRAARCRSPTRCRSRGRSPRRSRPRTNSGSSTAI